MTFYPNLSQMRNLPSLEKHCTSEAIHPRAFTRCLPFHLQGGVYLVVSNLSGRFCQLDEYMLPTCTTLSQNHTNPPLQGERAKGVSEVGFHLSIFPWSSFIFFSESEHLSRSSGLDLGGCIIFCLWLHCIIFSFCFFRPPAGGFPVSHACPTELFGGK